MTHKLNMENLRAILNQVLWHTMLGDGCYCDISFLELDLNTGRGTCVVRSGADTVRRTFVMVIDDFYEVRGSITQEENEDYEIPYSVKIFEGLEDFIAKESETMEIEKSENDLPISMCIECFSSVSVVIGGAHFYSTPGKEKDFIPSLKKEIEKLTQEKFLSEVARDTASFLRNYNFMSGIPNEETKNNIRNFYAEVLSDSVKEVNSEVVNDKQGYSRIVIELVFDEKDCGSFAIVIAFHKHGFEIHVE